MSGFRLQPVMKLRQYAEELRKRDLAEALAEERRRKDVVLRLAESRKEQSETLRRRQRQDELDVREMIEHRQYMGLLEREIHLHLRHVAVAERQTHSSRLALMEAVRSRKAIDVLRRRFDERLQQKQSRLETAEMDEVASSVNRGNALRHPIDAGGRP